MQNRRSLVKGLAPVADLARYPVELQTVWQGRDHLRHINMLGTPIAQPSIAILRHLAAVSIADSSGCYITRRRMHLGNVKPRFQHSHPLGQPCAHIETLAGTRTIHKARGEPLQAQALRTSAMPIECVAT